MQCSDSDDRIAPAGGLRARVLPRAFYARPTLDVTADLIGKVLVHELRGVRTSGVIVETEAYIGEDDPACHAAPGPTERNRPLYGPPGRAYVYLNYGIHYLMNTVTEGEGCPAAVLIRALAPLEGIETMRRRRAKGRGTVPADVDLCRGPGNLTVALGISLAHNTRDLTFGPLRIEDRGVTPPGVEWSPRIGIRVGTEQAWRCAWVAHPAVSGRRAWGPVAGRGSRSAR
jgi:DNA-3-methyladenine glycosylase